MLVKARLEQQALLDRLVLPQRRTLLASAVLFLVMMAGWYWLADNLMHWVADEDITNFATRSRDSADQIATNLARGMQDEVRRLGNLPDVMADDAVLRDALLLRGGKPDLVKDRALLHLADLRLAQLAELLELDLAYVVDQDGICVAAANFDRSESVVGTDLRSRSYFTAIENGGRGRQFGFGVKTGVPGVYFSAAVRQDGKFFGGVVIKRSMRNLFRLTTRNAALLVDEFGVVVAATAEQALWHYLPDSSAAGLGSDFLRERYRLDSVQMIEIRPDPDPAPVTLVRLFDDPVPSLMTTRPIGDSGLRLVYFTPLPDLKEMRVRAGYAFWLVLLSGGLVVMLVVGAFFYVLQSRARIVALNDSYSRLAELSEALSAEKEVAQAADRAKSRFLAMMSHELRTPFSGILGTVDLLRASDLPKASLALVGLLERSARSLLALLNNMLDFSKIEAGQLRPEKISFDLRPMVADLRDIQCVVARAKGISLEVGVPRQPLVGLGDPSRLRQILDNFLSNAIKFTSQGGVRMSVATDGAGESRLLRVRVEDSGPGLSDDAKAQLFQPFFQADDSTSRKHGGTGLGLAICRGIAHSLGGDVGVESREGEGACFWLEVPFAETDQPPVTGERPDHDEGLMQLVASAQVKSILLVDDDEVNRLVIGGMLSKVGHKVSFALDGHQALREVGRYHYDLVIMDMHMPEMDGMAATRAIRTLSDHRASVPIIGLTADAIAENRPTYLAAGLDILLTKPVSATDLLAAVKQITNPPSP